MLLYKIITITIIIRVYIYIWYDICTIIHWKKWCESYGLLAWERDLCSMKRHLNVQYSELDIDCGSPLRRKNL